MYVVRESEGIKREKKIKRKPKEMGKMGEAISPGKKIYFFRKLHYIGPSSFIVTLINSPRFVNF